MSSDNDIRWIPGTHLLINSIPVRRSGDHSHSYLHCSHSHSHSHSLWDFLMGMKVPWDFHFHRESHPHSHLYPTGNQVMIIWPSGLDRFGAMLAESPWSQLTTFGATHSAIPASAHFDTPCSTTWSFHAASGSARTSLGEWRNKPEVAEVPAK